MRCKAHSVLGNFAKLGERKYLESTAVGKYRSVPAHKLMKTSELFDQLVTGSDMEMISIGKLHLTSDIHKVDGRHSALNGGTGANVHKYGSFNVTVNGVKNSSSGVAFCLFKYKHYKPLLQ